MGTKYTIEVEDKPFELLSEDGFTSEKLFRVKGFNSLVFDWNGLNMLTPYTEPDLEQVRKEAYENGYENGFIAGHLKAEKSGQSFYEGGYKRGLADAWDAARKIVLPGDVSGIYLADLEEIFDRSSLQDVIKDYSASECIEKIRQYEQEKDRQARIEYNFDEIKDVLETTAKECNVSLDEIAEVLAKMKES